MNSFTDGKPIEQPQAAKPTVISVGPKTTPRYGLFGFLIILGLLAYLIYDLQAAKKQIHESQTQLATAKKEFSDRFDKNDESMQAFRSDFNVVRDRLGVTQKELDRSRQYTQQIKADQERSVAQLHAQMSEKADTHELSALKQEATTQFGKVNSDVTAVKGDVDATKKQLEGTRRELVDVKDTLTQQIARNRDEVQQLRLKGERNFYEFDIDKKKKVALVGDVRLMLLNTNAKKKKYAVRIVVDDNQLEKKDRTINEPVQFLVGKTKLRYELVVNEVTKDRIVGYLSTPKDKGLSAEFVKN